MPERSDSGDLQRSSHHDVLSDLGATLENIKRLQAAVSTLPQVELKTDHYFADGMYLRAVWRPADTLIVGKVHRREHIFLVMSGDVTITGDGYRKRVQAPYICVSDPGTKRATYAHEASLCVTVHRTDKRSLDDIEADLVEPDDTALFNAHNELKVQLLK